MALQIKPRHPKIFSDILKQEQGLLSIHKYVIVKMTEFNLKNLGDLPHPGGRGPRGSNSLFCDVANKSWF